MRIYGHSLFYFIPIWTNLNETHLPFSCSIEMLSLNDERLKKWNLNLSKSSMHIYAHSLFYFIPIWTNLNETHLPYSCGIEMIFFNDEKLKKSNLRLLKSTVRIYAHLCVSMRINVCFRVSRYCFFWKDIWHIFWKDISFKKISLSRKKNT